MNIFMNLKAQMEPNLEKALLAYQFMAIFLILTFRLYSIISGLVKFIKKKLLLNFFSNLMKIYSVLDSIYLDLFLIDLFHYYY